jgi:hypothetical protein
MRTVITVIFHSQQQRQQITLYTPRRTANRNAILKILSLVMENFHRPAPYHAGKAKWRNRAQTRP